MLGYGSAEEIRGRQAADLYFDAAERSTVMEELKREGALREQEIQLRRKDGTPVWFLFNVVLLASPQGTQMAQGTLIDISKRKRAEEDLVRREEDYRLFVAQSSEGIFREELDVPVPLDLPEDELVQRILDSSYIAGCNDAMARMYGLTSGSDLVGKRLSAMLLPGDPRNVEMTRDYVRSGFRVLDRESHEVDVHGDRKIFRNSLIGIIENGNLVRTWGIQRDVTEQVRLENARATAEAALRKSEEHFRLLVEQASDGIFLADSQGRYIDVNTAGAQMLGYSREELLKLSICDVISPSDVARIASELSRFAEGATLRSDWIFRRKDGSFFPGEVCGKQLPDGRLQGILRDMSERRRAEQEMRHSEERFRVALKDSPITVFNQDQDLRYTWIYNPQLYWQFDALGKTDEEIVGARKSAKLTSLKRQVLTTGLAVRDEVTVRNAGKGFVFDMTIEPLLDSAGNVVGITGACMDIAKIRELADRLQDSRDRLQQEKSYLETEIRTELGFEHIIGESPALREVLKKARIVAPTDSTVLLLGETGTGKELVARSLHSLSTRRDKTFVKLNCAAVPSGLLESELFGHEKGAFTSAVSQKIGRIELADKGTLFLDEIGELPQELQPKLLRVLQDREFERLGGVHTLRVDVRIISATNRDLLQDVLDKKFREDLYYRLNVFPIHLPALRERREDIAILVQHFVEKHARRMGKHIDIIPDESMRILSNWKWPGNVRELENMIERMIILTTGNVLAAPPAGLEAMADCPTDDLSEMEREHIIHVLRETNGVLSGAEGAAVRLGLKRTTLQSMLKRFGIEAGDFRRGNGAGGHN
jgi:formate hydrogenlyase transcriptional activator